MSFNVTISFDFAREAKRISKKHPGIKADIAKLIADLEKNPKMGTDLGQNFYKIRLSITGQIKANQVAQG